MEVLLGISIVAIILFAQTANVTAINDQGLEWGVEVGDRFDYDFEVSYHNSTFDLELTSEMYVVINALGSISDNVTSLPNIPIPSLYLGDFTTYWSNGTVMDDFWKGIPFMGATFIAYPIGNWTLITQLFEDVYPSGVTQNATMLNYTIVDIPIAGNVVSQVYQKSNGVTMSQLYDLAWGETTVYVKMTLTSSTTSTTTSGTTGTATGGGDNTLILILGGGAAIAIVVIVIVFMRRK
jgi:hypothetical protein